MIRAGGVRVSPVDLVRSLLLQTDDIVAVTGATGWIGSAAMDLLYEALGDEAPFRVTGYASTVRELVVSDGRAVVVRPLRELSTQSAAPTTLLHFAFLTRDRVAELGIDAYTCQNVAITTTVLDAIARHRPRRVVTASSGAVYSTNDRFVSDLSAEPYGTLKRLDELALRAATHDAGGVCVVPRIFSLGGRHMTKSRLYALGDMIAMAAAGGPIDVRAQGPVLRSYCGADEVVALALWVAFSGRSSVFDTYGPSIELGDLALMVAEVHGLPPSAVHRTWNPAASTDRYVGDGRLMEALASEAGLRLRTLHDLVAETSLALTGSNPITPA